MASGAQWENGLQTVRRARALWREQRETDAEWAQGLRTWAGTGGISVPGGRSVSWDSAGVTARWLSKQAARFNWSRIANAVGRLLDEEAGIEAPAQLDNSRTPVKRKPAAKKPPAAAAPPLAPGQMTLEEHNRRTAAGEKLPPLTEYSIGPGNVLTPLPERGAPAPELIARSTTGVDYSVHPPSKPGDPGREGKWTVRRRVGTGPEQTAAYNIPDREYAAHVADGLAQRAQHGGRGIDWARLAAYDSGYDYSDWGPQIRLPARWQIGDRVQGIGAVGTVLGPGRSPQYGRVLFDGRPEPIEWYLRDKEP